MNLKDQYKDLVPYYSKNITKGIILNSNESPFLPPKPILEEFYKELKKLPYNRYPDMAQEELKIAIANAYNVEKENVTCGVGSDELLDVIFRGVLNKDDVVVSFSPSFSMYKVFAKMEEAKFIDVYNNDYSLDKNQMIEAIDKYNPKIVLICNPNNPTGQVISKEDVLDIASHCSLLILDLAYNDFAKEDLLPLYSTKNIICLKTFSKAFSLPSIRVGFAISSKENIEKIDIIKPPYTVNSISMLLAKIAIENKDLYNNNIKYIIKERDKMYTRLKDLGLEILNSEANFLFVKLKDIDFLASNIYIRSFGNNLYRITIGLKEENDMVYEVIKNAYK